MGYETEEHQDGDWRPIGGASRIEELAALMVIADRHDTTPRRITRDGVPVLFGRHPVVHEEQEPEWRPIETAPRDGTEVDLWDGKRRRTDCHFHCGEWLQWNTSSVDDEPSWIIISNPTHWQPQPPPPPTTGDTEF